MLELRSHPGRGSLDRARSTRRASAAYRRHAAEAVSRIATLLGAVSVLDAIWPREWRVLHDVTPVLPLHARAVVCAFVAVAGVLLLRIAAGLRKRMRTEWRIAVGLCISLTVAQLVRDDRRPIELVITILLLAALLTTRSEFTAESDPHSRWFAVRVASQFLAVAVAYGMVALYLPHRVIGSASFLDRLREVLLSIAGLGGSLNLRGDRFADAFHATLIGFGLLTVVCAVTLFLRPSEPLPSPSPADEQRLRELLMLHGGRDSLGYFALRRDKSVVWSPTGKAAITFRVVYGVALISGDPIGDPEAWPGAIDAYRKLIARYGWTPAAMGCSELGAIVLRRECGLSALALGDEAIVWTASFCLQGRSMRSVRQARTRLARAGYTVDVRRVADIDNDGLAELRAAAEAWRPDAVERGYSMALSRIGDANDPQCVVVTARQGGELRGLLHFVPWGIDGLSLDLMRRKRCSDNGVNELMIAGLMEHCPQLGVNRVSLNFAVFRDALERGQRIGAGPVSRLWRKLLLFGSRWWQIESLYRFNAKFQPQWQPRFICFPHARTLPRIALAALEAEAFIVRPKQVKRLLGRG